MTSGQTGISPKLAEDVVDIIGLIDCSSSPNFPIAKKGNAYYVSVSGRIGGLAGKMYILKMLLFVCKTL